MNLSLAHVEPLFGEVERAIHRHPLLVAVGSSSPTLLITREGFVLQILAVRRDSMKNGRLTTIHGRGDTPQMAMDALIERLDIWAEVMR